MFNSRIFFIFHFRFPSLLIEILAPIENFSFHSAFISAMAFSNPSETTTPVEDLSMIPRPRHPNVHIIIEANWMAVAQTFLPNPDQEPDVRDLVVAIMNSEQELDLLVDLVKQTISNYVYHFHQQYLRKREFSLVLSHPHTGKRISLNWDDTWRETLGAQSIPFNIGLLQLEVCLSRDYTFQPRVVPN